MPDEAACRGLFAEMIERFREAPAPRPLPGAEVSREYYAKEESVAVMYGWTNRVMRTGQAVLRMDADGFATEASPLLRSMFEHVIALHWLKEQPNDAFQSLFRGWQKDLRTYRRAEAVGWNLNDETLALIDDILNVETDDSTQKVDYLLQTAHRAEKYGLGLLYRSWLIETWTSHATLSSAKPYYEAETEGPFTLLEDNPQVPPDVSFMCTAAGLTALDIYNRLLPADFLKHDLANWRTRLGPTF